MLDADFKHFTNSKNHLKKYVKGNPKKRKNLVRKIEKSYRQLNKKQINETVNEQINEK